MALNISRICDSQDRHQGRANKGTLNTESGISAAEILVSALPLGEEQPAGLLKNSGVCWFFFCFILLLFKKKKKSFSNCCFSAIVEEMEHFVPAGPPAQ